MKKNYFIALLLFGIFLLSHVQINAQSMNNYDSQWKEVDKLERNGLPKSALEKIDILLRQAISEKNTPQVIKSIIYKNKNKTSINDKEQKEIFTDLENLLSETENIPDKSLLHSMLAELYLNYYSRNSWLINQRTDLSDYVPEDMEEWPKNIFFNKATEHINASVENKDILLQNKTTGYKEILITEKDTEKYYPTLYDFLMYRAINLSSQLPVNDLNRSLTKQGISVSKLAGSTTDFVKMNFGKPEAGNELITLIYYQDYINSLLERNMIPTLILTELSKIAYLQNQSQIFNTNYQLEALLNLQKEYESNPASVEIIEKIAAYYNTTPSGYYPITEVINIQENQDNKKKAYDWLVKGIQAFPDYERINILKNALADMEIPRAQITGNSVYHPEQKNKTLTLSYTNLEDIKIIIQKETGINEYTTVQSYSIPLHPQTTYSDETQEIEINLDETGKYKIEVEFDKEQATINNPFFLYISRIAAFSRMLDKNRYEFYVVDRLSGKPIENAVISIKEDSVIRKEIYTEKTGIANYLTEEDLNDYSTRYTYSYTVSLKEDAPDIQNNLPYNYYFSNPSARTADKETERISIFTDRSIYRPGQTVYFKTVALQIERESNFSPIEGKEYTIKLYNANNQLVTEKTFRTNEFGSFAGEFILPQNGLTGSYRIEAENKSIQYIQVEEYKRPTFQVTFDKIEKTYTFGEKVVLKGHVESFSGVKLQNTTVEYSISKSNLWRWQGGETPVESGLVTTNNDGSFEIEFIIPENDSRNIPFWRNIVSYSVDASVTDINGETQTGNYMFSVGEVSLILSSSLPDKVDKNSVSEIYIRATNLNGQDIPTTGNYTVYSLNENDSIIKEITKGSFTTSRALDLSDEFKKLNSGKYKIKFTARDSNNREVESENIFILYSYNDKKPPVNTNEWLIEKNTTFGTIEPAEFILGISAKDATVLYEVFANNTLIERRQIKFSDENKAFTIPYKEEYGENVSVYFTYIIDGKFYQQSIYIRKESARKSLLTKFEVFRDKLRPGQQEEWRISVKDLAGNPVFAELLISMYDISLDKIYPATAWYLNTFINTNKNYISGFSSDNSFRSLYNSYNFDTKKYSYSSLAFDRINWFGLLNNYGYGTPTGMMRMAASSDMLQESISTGYAKEAGGKPAIPEEENTVPHITGQKADNTIQEIRRNFNETAFFYPQLKTDKNGDVFISFTVPESNTSWKIRALAYDKMLNIGGLEVTAISRKELMVTPNLPRFMRQGDKTGISTKISNLSEGTVSGNVRIEFFNPLTNEISGYAITNQIQNFNLEKDASVSVEWIFEVPVDIDIIGCRIIAQSETFSDGEQHAIPVLPNRMLVTESLAMHVNSGQTKKFIFDKLVNNNSGTLSNYRLTLEYASNPAWYAVQALPVLSNPTNENSVNWFASYYVNNLGYYITQQYPKVSAMINTWKQQGATRETLTSALMKNEELKTVLLEETPWVMDAKDEAEQMQRLSLLFDLNNTQNNVYTAVDKLRELQNNDGGWSWYKGFSSSRSITQYILYGFTGLVETGAAGFTNEVKQMQIKAINYIDNTILKDFNELKKNNNNWRNISSVSSVQLEYLFVRSGYRDIPISQEALEAEKFYTSVVEKNWTKLNLYERSLLTVLAYRNGNKELADKISKSIKEYSSTDEEMGMYWANNKNKVFMSLSAVSTHVFLMKALQETGNASEQEMDRMKQWLLKQKQTQLWESTHASMDAIYALLSTGNDWFSSDGQVIIQIGNQVIEPENTEAGTGYFKEVWNKPEIKPEMGNVEISNSADNPSYGALYWQYYEELDKITGQEGVLNVEKKLFMENSSGTGKSLSEITGTSDLKTGDKVIVRLTIRSDRDMEFVQLKDMRASCFEPVETISGIRWQNALPYYQSTRDASTNFYFNVLPKGTYVIEYPVYVSRTGEYSNGITTIQCMYAPEFVSHTTGMRIEIK